MAEDPTLTLRKHIAKNSPILVAPSSVTIGSESFSAQTKSTYTNSRNQPYTLSSIAYLHSTRELDHGDYIIACRAIQIEPVSYLDREKILKDLVAPLLLSKTKIVKRTRSYPIDINRILGAYAELKQSQPSGMQYILVPRDDSEIRSILFSESSGNIISLGDHKYKLVKDPSEVESIEKLAAVFVDGSSWQFNDWPSSLTSRMKYIPVLFLLLGNTSTPPSLPDSATILRVDDAPDCKNRITTAFWSIMGVPST